MLAELIQQHREELKIRDNSELLETSLGKLYIRNKNDNGAELLEVEFKEDQLHAKAVSAEVLKTDPVKEVRNLNDGRQGFRSD